MCIRDRPKSAGLSICRLIIRSIYLLIPKSKQIAIKNIEICLPNISDPEKLYYKSANTLAENLYLFCLFPKIDQKFIDENIDYAEFVNVVNQCKKKSNGILASTAHIGMFELAAYSCPFLGFPTNILARGLNLPNLDSWINKIREKNGNKIFSRKGAYKKSIQYLRNGEHVAMLCDQNVKRRNSVFIDLFGTQASSTVTIGHAVAKTKCALLFTVLVRTSAGKYKYIAREIDTNFETKDLAEFTKLVMRNYHLALEDVIREYPEQWFWIHRRFKTRPEGQKEDFYD